MTDDYPRYVPEPEPYRGFPGPGGYPPQSGPAGYPTQGGPGGYPPRSGPGGPDGYPAPGAHGHGPRFGTAVAVAGFGVFAAGLFALPLQSYSAPASDIGFVNLRASASLFAAHPDTDQVYSHLAQFWWRFGALLFAGALLASIVAVVLLSSARLVGWLTAVLAAVAGVLTAVAAEQSADYRAALQQFQSRSTANMFDHPGVGLAVALSGLAVLAVGGVLVGLATAQWR